MKPNRLLTTLGLAASVLVAAIQPQNMVADGVPATIHYQGRVAVSGVPFDGIGQFKFALIGPGATAGSVVTYWSHDGTSQNGSEPTSSVPVTVMNGIYSVLLGDTQVPGTKVGLTPGVFDHERVELRVWFGGGDDPVKLLSPDQRVTSVAYALLAGEAATARQVAEGAVGSGQLADRSVTTVKIQQGAVGAAQLGNGSVTTPKLADGAVTAAKLAPVLSGTLKADRFEGDGTGLRGVVTGIPDLGIVRGMIKADGAIFMGEGFTASKTGKGIYKIQYQKPFSGIPIIVGSSATPGGTVSWNVPGFDSVEFTTTIGGTIQDAYFTFIAIGPR